MAVSYGDSSGMVHYLLLFTAFVVFVTVCYVMYSLSGYTFTKYPGVAGEAIVCTEGEVAPSNQSITIINDGDAPTVNPKVAINGVDNDFNVTVSDKGVRLWTDAMKLGCNNITYTADSDTRFKVKIDYMSHWRPIVDALEINNLLVGQNARYFISTPDADPRRIVRSTLNLTDITKDEALPATNMEFNGSTVRYKIEEPGNYQADMQVYDGYAWSDVYEVGFTAHVIQTDEIKNAVRILEMPDDTPLESPTTPPLLINPKDNSGLIFLKRVVNGGYYLWKIASDYVKSNVPRS